MSYPVVYLNDAPAEDANICDFEECVCVVFVLINLWFQGTFDSLRLYVAGVGLGYT